MWGRLCLYLVVFSKSKKVPRNRPEGPEVGRGIALLFLDLGAVVFSGGDIFDVE
jgi:hypothetical protein